MPLAVLNLVVCGIHHVLTVELGGSTRIQVHLGLVCALLTGRFLIKLSAQHAPNFYLPDTQ